jgi:iron(III) transport system substrate-binding protein
VYWNNELMHTLHLASSGALQPYASPSAEPIPAEFKDASGLWTGFAARARVLIVNTDKMPLESAPKSIRDLMKPEFKGKFAIAKPLFGTTMTHAAALFAAWGDESAGKFFKALKANDAVVCEGNAHVMRVVSAGDIPCGLTDTDDANVALKEGKPVAVVYLDQEDGGLGTLVIPNSIMLLTGAPNPENGKKLIDWALSPEVEGALAAGTSVQMPLNPGVALPDGAKSIANVKAMKVDWAAAAGKREKAAKILTDLFLGN